MDGHAHADVVIVGAGAAGAAFAWRIAGHGLKVLCLEQGDWVRSEQSPDTRTDWELALQSRFHPNPNVRALPADYPVDDSASPIKVANYNAVGGSTVRWGAHFPRMHPSDFRCASLDGVGADWPLSYEDLEPYYALNDIMMGVSGLAGDPANPPRAPRPDGPLPLCDGTRRLAAGFDALGWHWWPSDAAIVTSAGNSERQVCNNCGPCGLGCSRRARASADNTYWPAALELGVQLQTGATVLALSGDPGGERVSSVTWRDDTGRVHETMADTVVLAASGLGTPRLLQTSIAGDSRLAGIDVSGQLGRNLMLHPTAIVTGVFDEPVGGFRGPFACALYSQQFYETDASRGFTRGFQHQALRGQAPLGTALGGYMDRLPWGRDHHQQFVAEFDHSVSLTVTTEDLPEAHNRVDLHPTATDSRGLAVPRVHYRIGSNTQAILDFGIARASEVLRAAGAATVKVNPLSRQAGFHFMGTTRMGSDPMTSVVDDMGRSHRVPNLLVIDGSVFASAAAVNPTPTIQAVALRCADGLLRRAGVAVPPVRVTA